MIDNSEILAPLIDLLPDGDTFWYTELLDRSITKGENRFRVLRSFEHISRAQFMDQLPTIRRLCERNFVRAVGAERS